MTRVGGELRDERPLGAAVALPERVQGVDRAEQVRERADEVRVREAAETIRPGEPAEDLLGGGLDPLRQAEQVALAEGDLRISPAQA